MQIRVYDKNLNFLGVVEDFQSLLWCRKYYEPGEFELTAPATERNRSLLSEGNIITFRSAKEAGVIEAYYDTESAEGSSIVRRGYFLSAKTGNRIIKWTVTFSGTAAEAMKYLVEQVVPIPLLQTSAAVETNEKLTIQATWKNLQSLLTKIAMASGIGYRIKPDFENKILYFETYSGTDHSAIQSENPRVVFSKKNGNLNDITYEMSKINYKNVFYIGGQGTGADRKIIVLGDTSAEDLREYFVDADDIDPEEMTNEEYEAALIERGLEKQAEYGIKESLEGYITESNQTYRKDWDLGDIVTCRYPEWNIEMDQRITEIQETYEDGGMTIEPTFGDALPTSLDLET